MWTNQRSMSRRVEDALLYIGVSTSHTAELMHYNAVNPVGLFWLLNYLNENDFLPAFLTQMLLVYRPVGTASVAFVEHLHPLGLDWDRGSNQIRPTSSHPEAENRIRNELGSLLAGVDASYPSMLEGAWEAYYSDNPDRYRHAISSCRELLNQVTTELAGGEKLERQERVRRILGSGHKTEVVESAADLVNAIYGAQSAEEHTDPDASTALYVLVETEHIVYFILKHRKGH